MALAGVNDIEGDFYPQQIAVAGGLRHREDLDADRSSKSRSRAASPTPART